MENRREWPGGVLLAGEPHVEDEGEVGDDGWIGVPPTVEMTIDMPLPSVIQRIWDAELRHTRLHLVLCGSYVSFMEREILGARNPDLLTWVSISPATPGDSAGRPAA